jgi:hypothetical protein
MHPNKRFLSRYILFDFGPCIRESTIVRRGWASKGVNGLERNPSKAQDIVLSRTSRQNLDLFV